MMVAGSRRGKRESVVPRREGLWRCGGALCPLDSLARRLSGQITSGLDGTRESGTVQSLPFQARPSASAEGEAHRSELQQGSRRAWRAAAAAGICKSSGRFSPRRTESARPFEAGGRVRRSSHHSRRSSFTFLSCFTGGLRRGSEHAARAAGSGTRRTAQAGEAAGCMADDDGGCGCG